MSIRQRLVLLAVAVLAMVAVGLVTTGSLYFLLNDFWFVTGFLLLILLSLLDQHAYPKDPHVLSNGVAGTLALLLLAPAERSPLWWLLLVWTLYLILASAALVWLRRDDLGSEPPVVQLFARVNRIIGRRRAVLRTIPLGNHGSIRHQLARVRRTCLTLGAVHSRLAASSLLDDLTFSQRVSRRPYNRCCRLRN